LEASWNQLSLKIVFPRKNHSEKRRERVLKGVPSCFAGSPHTSNEVAEGRYIDVNIGRTPMKSSLQKRTRGEQKEQ